MKVYQAIAAVTAELSKVGISKDSTNTFDKYKFRGIDALYGALSPLLAKHQLCILPRVTHREVIERESKGGGALFYTTLTIEYDFVHAEDGSKHTLTIMGEAMDRGDKSLNKALSAGFKYLCFQAFCIPVEGDPDADSETHEVVSSVKKPNHQPVSRDVFQVMNPEEQAQLREIAVAAQTFIASGEVDDAVVMIDQLNLDADSKVALWSLFSSTERSALKKASSSLRVAA